MDQLTPHRNDIGDRAGPYKLKTFTLQLRVSEPGRKCDSPGLAAEGRTGRAQAALHCAVPSSGSAAEPFASAAMVGCRYRSGGVSSMPRSPRGA